MRAIFASQRKMGEIGLKSDIQITALTDRTAPLPPANRRNRAGSQTHKHENRSLDEAMEVTAGYYQRLALHTRTSQTQQR